MPCTKVERIEQGRGDEHGAIDARLAFLQDFEHQHASDSQRQRSGRRQPAWASVMPSVRTRPVGALGLAVEGAAFAGGAVLLWGASPLGFCAENRPVRLDSAGRSEARGKHSSACTDYLFYL